MQIGNPSELREHLVGRLSSLSDSDPEALADYILALLRHEKPREELKAFCINQLGDFLHESKTIDNLIISDINVYSLKKETEWFVEGLLRRLEGRPFIKEEEQDIRTMDRQEARDTVMSNALNMEASHEEEREPDRRFRREREREKEMGRVWEGREWKGRGGRQFGRNRSRSPHNVGVSGSGYRRDFHHRMPGMGYAPRGRYGMGSRHSIHGNGVTSGFTNENRREALSNRRLVIDKIPPEYCSIAKVNEYFVRFGSVVNITVHPEISRARLEYSTEEEARAAHSCPDVIFGNRFVKVYWDHDALPTPHYTRHSPSIASTMANAEMAEPGSLDSTSPSSIPIPSSISMRPPEPVQKKQEALRGMLELQKQKQVLLVRYIDQQKEMLTRLEGKGLTEVERAELMQSLKNVDELIKSLKLPTLVSGVDGQSTTNPPVDADLGADNVPSMVAPQPHAPILRGGPAMMMGRMGGRGAFRGAYKPPYGTGGKTYRLDLRPTAFALHPIPPRMGRDINSIRKIFESYGEIKNITINGEDQAIVSFTRRADSEKAFAYISKADMGDPFEVQWVTSSALPPAQSTEISSTRAPNGNFLGGDMIETNAADMADDGTRSDQIMFTTEEPLTMENEDTHWRR